MRVRIEPEQLTATPGVSTSLTVTVFNTSEIIQGFRVAISGLVLPVPTLSAPADLSLFPDTEGITALTFTLPRDFPAGAHTASVDVTGVVADAATITESVPLALLVEPVYDAAVTLEPQSVTGGARGRFSIVAENRGNVPLPVTLSASDGEAALRARFAATELVLPPGRRVRAAMVVKGKRPFLGSPKARILTVRASPAGNPIPPVESIGSFIQKPLVPRALLTLMAVLLALGLWGTVLFRGVNRAASEVAAEVAPQGSGTAVVVGRVVDGMVGLGGVEVVAKGKDGTAETTSLTEGDVGAFKLEGLTGPDNYLVTFAKEGFASQTMPVEVKEGEGVQAGLIKMGRGRGSVTGTVTAASGQPLGDVAVTLNRGGFAVGRAVTEAAGSVGFYSLGGLESTGPYLLTFSRPGYVSQSREVAVAKDAPATVDAALVPASSSSLNGLVTFSPVRVPACGPGACPLAGVAVTAISPDGDRATLTASAPAGEAGRYTIPELREGSYTVSFAKAGFVTQTLRVTLGTGQPVSINVTMRGDPGALSGTAPACTAVEARRRDLSELDPRRLVAPAEDGTYLLSDLPTPGEYRLVFRGPVPRTLDVNLGPGEQRALNASCTSASTTTSSTTTTTTTVPEGEVQGAGAETPPPPPPPSSTTTTAPPSRLPIG